MSVLRYCCFRWLVYDRALVFEPSRPLACIMMLVRLIYVVELCCNIFPWVPDLDRTHLRAWFVYGQIGGVTHCRASIWVWHGGWNAHLLFHSSSSPSLCSLLLLLLWAVLCLGLWCLCCSCCCSLCCCCFCPCNLFQSRASFLVMACISTISTMNSDPMFGQLCTILIFFRTFSSFFAWGPANNLLIKWRFDYWAINMLPFWLISNWLHHRTISLHESIQRIATTYHLFRLNPLMPTTSYCMVAWNAS